MRRIYSARNEFNPWIPRGWPSARPSWIRMPRSLGRSSFWPGAGEAKHGTYIAIATATFIAAMQRWHRSTVTLSGPDCNYRRHPPRWSPSCLRKPTLERLFASISSMCFGIIWLFHSPTFLAQCERFWKYGAAHHQLWLALYLSVLSVYAAVFSLELM